MSVLETLRIYLTGGMEFNSLEDRIVRLAFRADDREGRLVYEILAEIAYVKDGVLDEAIFRARIANIVRKGPGVSAQNVAS